MFKAGGPCIGSEEGSKTPKHQTQPPPERRVGVMTLGVQLCLRWFMYGQRITAGEDVQRLNRQAQQHGRGEGRGPAIDEGDVESIAAMMLVVTGSPEANSPWWMHVASGLRGRTHTTLALIIQISRISQSTGSSKLCGAVLSLSCATNFRQQMQSP